MLFMMDINGEKDLFILLQHMQPELNDGEYVFCSIRDERALKLEKVLFSFKEKKGLTVVLPKKAADAAGLSYTFISSWITLKVLSSLFSTLHKLEASIVWSDKRCV